MRFVFPHSHAFRGGRVVVEEISDKAPECLVEFGDGTTVIARWEPKRDEIDLFVPAYRTTKGTEVSARQWHLTHCKHAWRSQPRSPASA